MKKFIFVFLTGLALSFALFTSSASADYYSDKALLYKGIQSNEVADLQGDLQKLGYFNSNPTGYFGNYTLQIVVNYQKDRNLIPDGVVGPKTSRQIKVDRVLQTADMYKGVPYVWGGVSPAGFDCSGFTHYVMLKNNIIIPRTAEQQYNTGIWVAKTQLKPGDLIFFSTYKPGPSHVGIYLGNNRFMHASSGWGYITTSDLNNSYFNQHYLGAKRII